MQYPKSKDKKIRKLTNILVKWASDKNLEFTLGGEPLYPVETFSDFGGLSLFLIEAKPKYEEVFNKNYGCRELMSGLKPSGSVGAVRMLSDKEDAIEKEVMSKVENESKFNIEFHEKTENTFFGFTPKIGKDLDFFVLAHLTHFVADEYVKYFENNKMLLIDGKIPLEPLCEKMLEKVQENVISVIASPKTGITTN